MYNYPKHIRNKIVSVKELLNKLSRLRIKKKVALCHGTFDIFHPGHIRHLTYAKLKSDILIASVTSDKYVTKKKEGAYVPDSLRSLNLASLEIVDFVVIDNNLEPLNILSKIKPDYFVKGFEYSISPFVILEYLLDMEYPDMVYPADYHAIKIFQSELLGEMSLLVKLYLFKCSRVSVYLN